MIPSVNLLFMTSVKSPLIALYEVGCFLMDDRTIIEVFMTSVRLSCELMNSVEGLACPSLLCIIACYVWNHYSFIRGFITYITLHN